MEEFHKYLLYFLIYARYQTKKMFYEFNLAQHGSFVPMIVISDTQKFQWNTIIKSNNTIVYLPNVKKNKREI